MNDTKPKPVTRAEFIEQTGMTPFMAGLFGMGQHFYDLVRARQSPAARRVHFSEEQKAHIATLPRAERKRYVRQLKATLPKGKPRS